jgi:hypothetical protein
MILLALLSKFIDDYRENNTFVLQENSGLFLEDRVLNFSSPKKFVK